ncbi:MAG: hypothetical protein IT495_14290 [Gammaproteobacteria bacterium]|nr:hypothetical protein [Gammaproteobacteria bacterium]
MPRLSYLNAERMDALDDEAFRAAYPYPWINPAGFLTDTGYQRLVATLPDVSLFNKTFGYRRKYGQQGHDRYSLDYDPALPVAAPWHEFVRELLGEHYQRFLVRMLGRRHYRLQLHWHYTPNGCSVSPHCDAKRKIGSQLFYFNTADDWREEWGGQTLILDDHGRCDSDSAPDFDALDTIASARSIGNCSLLFGRKGNSWHGVRPIECPGDALRKVFIVVIEDWRLPYQLVSLVRGRYGRGFRPGQSLTQPATG